MANSRQQNSTSLQPVSIEVSNENQVLEITWSDGLESVYPLFGLRKNCPCVGCRGGHDRMGTWEKRYFEMAPARIYQIRNLETIGRHALKIHWSDGHNSGMYHWELLREMSPRG